MEQTMKIYQVEQRIYKYWYSENYPGFITEYVYFASKEKALQYIADYYKAPFWYDMNGKKAPIEDERDKGGFNLKEIEVIM